MEHKPFTKEQKALIDTCSWIIASWKHTNDKTSPTHVTDIKEELRKHDLDDEGMEDFEELLFNLFLKILLYEPDKV